MTVKQMKKEIAELLKEGKEPSATIRVCDCNFKYVTCELGFLVKMLASLLVKCTS